MAFPKKMTSEEVISWWDQCQQINDALDLALSNDDLLNVYRVSDDLAALVLQMKRHQAALCLEKGESLKTD